MLKIFNTLTCKKEIFKPIRHNKVNLYVCGVTVDDFCHIGHARTFTVFDMVVRYLRYSYFNVTYIRNITDIDDKIIAKSIKKNIDINIFTKNMINAMYKDFALLDLLVPDEEPRITHYIKDIINIISELIDKKYAYVNDDNDVVFSINSNTDYGALSHQSIKFLSSGSRVPINSMKKNPLDFILWKKENNHQFSWDAPWGRGRPGWHIECSTMISLFCDNALDIHGGGSDLLFPHHENERIQSLSLDQNTKINFWMHAGIVIKKNKKMSKSLGNTHFIKDILKHYDAESVRYFLLSTHYRQPIYYAEKYLDQARSSLERLYIALYDTRPIANISAGKNYTIDFHNAMDDDFNTPKAFSILFILSHEINCSKKTNKLQSNLLSFRLRSLAGSLGFLLQKPENFLQQKSSYDPSFIKEIELLIKKRNLARKAHLWIEADKIRNQLLDQNILLEDFPTETKWHKKINNLF